METLRFVLEDCKVDANQRAEGGMSALHVLASHPKWAGMDKEDSKMREKAIDILIKNGADANAQDKDGMKAIHTAAACKRRYGRALTLAHGKGCGFERRRRVERQSVRCVAWRS